LEESLGTKDFWRLRLGIDSRTREQRSNIPGEDYVLGKFTTEESVKLKEIFVPAWDSLSEMLG
jgi:peptidyl-tRNA hydrolase